MACEIFLTLRLEDLTTNLFRTELMLSQGMKYYRINFSKVSENNIQEYCYKLFELKERYKDIVYMIDLPIPKKKPRLETLTNAHIYVRKGGYIEIYSNKNVVSNDRAILVDDTNISDWVNIGDKIVYGDRNGFWEVISVDHQMGIIGCISQYDCEIVSKKSLYYGHLLDSFGEIFRYMECLKELSPKYIAFSFIESVNDIWLISKVLKNKELESEIICKIEQQTAFANIDEIAKNAHLMFGRGDYINTSNIGADLLSAQLDIANSAHINKSKLFVSTGILTSMIQNSFPSAADIIDLALIKKLDPFAIIVNRSVANSEYFLQQYKEIIRYLN